MPMMASGVPPEEVSGFTSSFSPEVLLDLCEFERFYAQHLRREVDPLAAEKVGAGENRCAEKDVEGDRHNPAPGRMLPERNRRPIR